MRSESTNTRQFPVTYWGPDQSTEVSFSDFSTLPDVPVSTCMVVALGKNGTIALARPERGWGFPGGHVEDNESPEECIRREAYEECGVTLGELSIIGGWLTKKVKQTEFNHQYPDKGCQLLYVAEIESIDEDYTPQLEIFERAFIPLEEFPKYRANFDGYAPIYDYIVETVTKRK